MHEVINILTITAAFYTYLSILQQQEWAVMSQKFMLYTFHHLKQTFAHILHNQGKKISHKQSTLRGSSPSFKVNRHFVTNFDETHLLLRLAKRGGDSETRTSIRSSNTHSLQPHKELCRQEKPWPFCICTGENESSQTFQISHGVCQSSCPRDRAEAPCIDWFIFKSLS